MDLNIIHRLEVFKMKKNGISFLVKSICKDLKNILSTSRINEIARQSKFIQRYSKKINALNFLKLTAFYGKNICTESLANLCNSLYDNDNISISSQALDERFNSKAVEFLKLIFLDLLALKIKKSLKFNNDFNRIMITDSTAFQLPDKFEKLFKGFNGSATKSGLKIQLTNDLMTGNILGLEISDVTSSDGKHLKTLESNTETKDLAIKDLGYYSLKHFSVIEKLDSYYVSRLKLNTSVYIKNEKPEKFKTTGNTKKSSEFIRLDLLIIANKLKENEIKEMEVYIGDKENSYSPLKTRLIIYKLSKELSDKKREHQISVEKKKQIPTSKKVIKLNTVNMFITNIEEEVLSKELIYLLYSLRWQIELIFKVWKSIYSIDKLHLVKNDRFLCHLYGTLISILMSTKFVFTIRNNIHNFLGKEISEYKTFKTIHEFSKSLGEALLKSFPKPNNILTKIIELTLKNGIKSRKNPKKTSLEILSLVNLESKMKMMKTA